MRDILFRGKRLLDGEWVYGCPVIYSTWNCAIFREEKMDDVLKVQIRPDTLSQSTGLSDCNCNRIFEGDIVRYKDEFLYIAYDINFAAFVLRDGHVIYETRQLTPLAARDMEVVGNIWDNPDLLEEDTQ